MSSADYFRPQDLAAFRAMARMHKLFIAVRRINPKSIPYIGTDGYAAKLLDCKAKTAKADIRVLDRVYKTAGLVIDCEVYERHLAQAFGAQKVETALDAWGDFVKAGKRAPLSIYGADGKSTLMTYNHGFDYFTQMDPNHPHFGCIRHSPSRNTRGGKYVHADYDLYALVLADDPANNTFVRGTQLGQPHARSMNFFNVLGYFSAHMQGMVNHGEQDTYKRDLDDAIDVFHPDGKVEEAIGAEAIARLYATTFKGRQMVAKGGKIVPATIGGDWLSAA